MKSFDKESFLLLLRVRPQWLIGKQIIYDEKTVSILDISVSGDYLHLEGSSAATEWVPASSLGDSIVIDMIYPKDTGNSRPFTAASLTNSIETLENRVGQPGSEQPKPLFEIVASLNKEVFELRQKIEEIESKVEIKKD